VAGRSRLYSEARDFMKMLMPTHTPRGEALSRRDSRCFSRMGVGKPARCDVSPRPCNCGPAATSSSTRPKRWSRSTSTPGRSTREHHIEDTALKTNLEAAEEVARQLRLRDLAGLIVIDFIDMDEKRNNRSVERKLSECLKHDRGGASRGRPASRISDCWRCRASAFRASVLESSTEPCPPLRWHRFTSARWLSVALAVCCAGLERSPDEGRHA